MRMAIIRVSSALAFAIVAQRSFSQSTVFFSVQNGSWHSTATWTNLLSHVRTPGIGDDAHVRHSVAVTQALTFARLHMQGGWLNISTGVTLISSGGTGIWNNAHVGGGGTFQNAGKVSVTGASATVIGGNFLNLGELTMVETPALQLDGQFHNSTQAITIVAGGGANSTTIQGTGAFHNAGTLFVSAGTTCTWSGARFHNQGGTVVLETGSQFQVSSSRGTNFNGFYLLETNAVFMPVSGGTNIYSGGFYSAGPGSMLMQTGSIMLGFAGGTGATFNIQGGGFNWLGGTMTVHPSYQLQNQGNMTIGGQGGTTQLLQGTLVNWGNINLVGSSGSVFNVAGGNITNQLSGTFTFGGTNPALSGGQFHNAGQVFFAAGGTTSVGMVFFNRGGTTTFQRGWANLYGEMYAGLFLLNGGYWGGGQSFYVSGGSVAGAGQIANNLVQSSGTISPGQSAGRLDIAGFFSQTTTDATLLMELAGTEPGTGYDQVVVGGTGTVGGVLTIELLDGYEPPPATRFDLILAPEVVGQFAETNLPALAGDHFWLVRYFTNTIQMRVGTPEDTDGDGLPDEWELHYFENLDVSDGGDDNSDDDVFTDWQEFIADTNPTNSTSYLRVLAVDPGPPIVVHFQPGSTGRVYSFQFTDNLAESSWSNVPGTTPRPGEGGADFMTDTNDAPFRSHRIQVELP